MVERKDYKYKKQNTNSELGKIPPQAVDIEEAVLGAIMLEQNAVVSVMDLLIPDSFYKDTHREIYRSVLDLSNKLQPIDLLTVTEDLRKRGKLEICGGAAYLAQLTTMVASSAHAEHHARIIAQKYIQRELIRVASDIQEKSFDDSIDVDDLLDYSEAALFKIAEGNIKKDVSKITPLLKLAVKMVEDASKKGDGLSGVPSGFTKLDKLTSGWQPSDLLIIAARPAMGKTAFVLSMTRNMAVGFNKAVSIFSLEMASVQLVMRLIASETELQAEKLKKGTLQPHEWTQLETKIKNLENAPIYIDDTPGISIFEFRAKARRLKQQYDIQIIIIDYLQLMTGPPETRGNREQEVSMISRSLKGIAKELNVPIIALSQLNRSVETRGGDKRPQLSDLRESGAIEQDADMVMFIHRPEYYGQDQDEAGNSLKGIAEIIVAKHRNGATDSVQLRFRNELAKFVDIEESIDEFGFGAVNSAPAVKTFTSKLNSGNINPMQEFDSIPQGMGANTSFDDDQTPF
ncbi:MAG: replicative DNA helicase [Bacteroidales bacterium]|nr:replicative DNA helicase [Bacteroidales bacterium]